MKTNTKKTNTKKTNTKKTNTKKNDVQMIIVNNIEMKIDDYRDDLLKRLKKSNIDKNAKLSKSLRHKLRKTCNYYGATRTRTYIDKSTSNNERIIINT